MRTDHLAAVIKYAMEQVKVSNGEINPLEFDANDNDCQDIEDVLGALNNMLLDVEEARQGASSTEVILIDSDAANSLLYMHIYDQFVRFGRNQSFNDIQKHFKDMHIHELTYDALQNGYDFACDLYDENESNGYNDDMHPHRVKLSRD